MEENEYSNVHETVEFGRADVFIEQPTSDDCSHTSLLPDVKSSPIAQETLSNNRTQQNEHRRVNYGPCLVCHANEACVLFIGCNHLACCDQCSQSCGNICPVAYCNQPIIERLRIFKPV